MLAVVLALLATQADKPASLLDAADLDAVRVLPPPPAPGSAQARAELAELHTMQATRTAAEKDAAERTGETKDPTIFAGVLGPRFDLARLPATARLLAVVRATERDAIDRGKDLFRRQRPWIVDPALNPCKLGKEPLSSYPSGHATNAYSMAAVLAQLVPAKAPALMARAAEYAETRITCEQHWRSDVTAGQAFGLLLAERLMAKPAFRAVFAQAQAELAAAGIR